MNKLIKFLQVLTGIEAAVVCVLLAFLGGMIVCNNIKKCDCEITAKNRQK
jgi:hypothetical protein